MYLLDTTVLSEIQRQRPSESVSAFIAQTDLAQLFTSVLVMGELLKGAHRLTDPVARTRFQRFIEERLTPLFQDRILPVTVDVARRWGEISGLALSRGQPLPAIDSLIAATALTSNLSVVTRNTHDFERCGAAVLNPWNR